MTISNASTTTNSVAPLAWAVLAALALGPAALSGQTLFQNQNNNQVVTIGGIQSAAAAAGEGQRFLRWIEGERCFASSGAWRLSSSAGSTEVYYKLDAELRDRTALDLDWQLTNPPDETLIQGAPDVGDRRSFTYLGILVYEIAGQSVPMDYRLVATEVRLPDGGADRPYRDTEVGMGAQFVNLLQVATGFRLGFYAQSRRYSRLTDADGTWGDWQGRAMALDLPIAGLAEAIRQTRTCAAGR